MINTGGPGDEEVKQPSGGTPIAPVQFSAEQVKVLAKSNMFSSGQIQVHQSMTGCLTPDQNMIRRNPSVTDT